MVMGCACAILGSWGLFLLKERTDSLRSISNLRNYANILNNPILKPDGTSMLGQPFIDFTLSEIGGDPLRLSDVRSFYKILVLFDLDDCNSCLLEYRMWSEITRRFKSEAVAVIGICTTLNRERIINFKQTRNITFPIVWDPDRMITKEMKFRTSPLRILLNDADVIEDISLTVSTPDNQRDYVDYLEKKIKKAS